MKSAAPVIAAVLLALAGCTSSPSSSSAILTTARPGACDPAAAFRLAGHARLIDAEAKRLTGARIVRQIAPGQPVQQDYTDARVTIESDPSTGRVVRAYCG